MSDNRERLTAQALEQIDALSAIRRRAFCSGPVVREISMPQAQLLMMLQERAGITVSELAALLGVSAPSASAILDRLEDHGLLARDRDPGDRRVVHVRLTNRGEAVVEEFMVLGRERMRRLMDTMSDREIADVSRGLKAVRAAFERLGTSAVEPVAIAHAGQQVPPDTQSLGRR